MIKVAIIGATGYAGEELIGLLLGHPQVEITCLAAKIEESTNIYNIFPKFKGRIDLVCDNSINVEDISLKADVVFLALPHRVSMQIAPDFIKKGKRVIDFSADYRLKDISSYEKWYEAEHQSKDLVAQSVYGLCELDRQKIKDAQLIANPGCFPTGAILAITPFLDAKLIEPHIILDAKTGGSGAGRKPSVALLYAEVNESFKAYKVCNHQHSPEILQQLQIVSENQLSMIFVPHLVPMNRGILSTMYLKLKNNMSVFEVVDTLKKFYADSPFVRIKEADEFPEIKDVANTNFCDIGVKIVEKQLVVIAAIDNLVKGASGQAVQNMNIMFGIDETTGLM